MSVLGTPLTLPCGATIANRIAKAAMTEGLADVGGRPTAELERLYGIWSDGGAGLLITGNVVIDADHLERPGNVVIDRSPDEAFRAALRGWAAAATRAGNHCWVQISHAGRQTMKSVNPHPKAPSAVRLHLPGGQFGEPVALTTDEVRRIPSRFALAAQAVREAGFSGVQIHAAHGYLLSQFLSPRSNLRDDAYGGDLAARARLLLEVVDETRAAVGADFPIAVKLNSADFQKGGFDFQESLQVAHWLQDKGIDLLEISGGTYEQPSLLGIEGVEPVQEQKVAASTLRREAYFVDFARAMHAELSVPLMVTGGLRRRAAMEEVISSGAAAMVGLGRPMCVQTDAPARLLGGEEELRRFEDELRLLPSALAFLTRTPLIKTLSGFAVQYWFYAQLDALGHSGAIREGLSVLAAARQVDAQQRDFLKARRALDR